MDRRTLLSAGGALAASAVAGCLGFGTVQTGVARAPAMELRMTPITDAAVAERVTFDARLDDERRRPLTDAIPDGRATVEATEPPVPADRPFVYEGAVYEFRHEVVDSTPATSFHVTLDPVEGTPTAAETVRYEDLPAVDRAVFAERGWDDLSVLGFGTSLRYLDSEVPDSALVPEPEHPVVVWDADTRGRFTVLDSDGTELHTYRYAASQVHESAASFGAAVRERHAFTLSDLPAEEAAVVEAAIEDEYGYGVPADESVPTPARSLAERFRTADEVDHVWAESADDSLTGSYLVRYEGAVYWTHLSVTAGLDSTPDEPTTRPSPSPTDASTETQ